MQIWPAIDIRGGRVVRLRQGDYQREQVFGENPAEAATRFVERGAQQLHLVDLDGAREGHIANWDSIEAILRSVDVPCQLGGGIRELASMERLFELGIARIVIGTRAVADEAWFRDVCQHFPHKVVLGIDARDGMVATHGWLDTSSTRATDLAARLEDLPLAAVVFTDIAQDGMLTGPNFPSIEAMLSAVKQPLIASGGVARREDVSQLAALGVAGCIVGRALYEGNLTLEEALAAAH